MNQEVKSVRRFPVGMMLILLSGCLFSLALSMGFARIAIWSNTDSTWRGAVGVLGYALIAFLVPVTVSIVGIVRAFRRGERPELLWIIIGTYIALTLCFASIYYSLVTLADYSNEEEKEIFYRAVAAVRVIDPEQRIMRYEDDRAFRGIDCKLWNGMDEQIPHYGWSTEPSVDELCRVVAHNERDFTRFEPQSRVPVLLDCIHLSIMTMTTVGYGDITPRSQVAKIATDAQALSAQSLFVVALGMLFGNWWDKK
jgi:hypothetical protein